MSDLMHVAHYKWIKVMPTLSVVMLLMLAGCNTDIQNYTENKTMPNIFPDYVNVVIPVNIAPLNFYIKDTAERYHVEIYSDKSDKIVIDQTSAKIKISQKKWHALLSKSISKNLFVDVFIKNKTWVKYQSIKDSVVPDSIDNHLVYRLINPAYIYWRKMGIYQRNLENFDQTPIFENKSADEACVNCHMFSKNNPAKMSLHFRFEHAGTIINDNGVLKKIDTKTPYTMGPCAYPSWHPGGEIIAYSVNIIRQVFTTSEKKFQDVYDIASDIVLYNVKTNTITTSPKVSTQNRENLPTWSPDGKWLYYISAPKADTVLEKAIKIKYDLVRIRYDVATNTWGEPDTVLTSRTTGMSITFPVISPEGRFLVCSMTDYGYFTIFHKMSDLYLVDLTTGAYHKMNLNSPFNESYHSWSSNGRWLAFSSKRIDNIFSCTHFAYIDKNGKDYKPFVMPQEDPLFYTTFDKNFNRPELVKGAVKLDANQMRDLVLSEAEKVKFDTTVDVDGLSGATWIENQKHAKSLH